MQTVSIWKMKCVGYDYEFQKKCIDLLKTYVPRKVTTVAGQKRKRPASVQSGQWEFEALRDNSEEEQYDEYPESEDEEEESLRRITEGTRSRPRRRV